MTDHYTDELFHEPNDDVRRLLFPVSRLLVDPERFADDELEPMTAVGNRSWVVILHPPILAN